MTPFIRSVLSVLGAFFVVAVLVGLTTTIAARLMLGSAGGILVMRRTRSQTRFSRRARESQRTSS